MKFPVIAVTLTEVRLVEDEQALKLYVGSEVVKQNAKPIDRVIAERTLNAVKKMLKD